MNKDQTISDLIAELKELHRRHGDCLVGRLDFDADLGLGKPGAIAFLPGIAAELMYVAPDTTIQAAVDEEHGTRVIVLS